MTAVSTGVRRLLGVLFLSTMVGVAGCVGAGAASATARPVMAGSSTPAPPSGSVGPPRAHFVKFCVKNFAASSTVRVTNRKTGKTVRLRTNAKGAGCVQVPIKRACHSVRQTIVGTGTGDDNKPATVKQTVTTQPTPSKCTKRHRHRVKHHGTGRKHHHKKKKHSTASARLASANSASVNRFSGADTVLAIIAALAILAAGTTLTLVRRRRAHH